MYTEIQQHIASDAVTIVAVSKKQPIEKINTAYAQGARHFGENYLQEADEKIRQCQHTDIHWHFIGALQANKTRSVAALFDWVQTVDRLKIGQRLSEQRPVHLPPLNICMQVNIDGEAQKSGCAPEEAYGLGLALAQLSGLRLRGIMLIPKQQPEAALRQTFSRAQQLYQQLQQQGLLLDTLSMGMSQDYPMALEYGATMVRIGTAVFGVRGG